MRSVAVVAAVALAACGLGHSQQGGDGDGSSPGPTPCPATLPNAGAPCSAPASLFCEYGDDVNGGCNRVAACSAGEWSLRGPSPSAKCPTPAASASCPASYAAVPVGADCTARGLTCGYAEGFCACLQPISGPPRVDGGAQWACDRPTTSCPSPRPRLGTACAGAGAGGAETCDYGSCSLPDGVEEQCTNGVWVPVPAACPL